MNITAKARHVKDNLFMHASISATGGILGDREDRRINRCKMEIVWMCDVVELL